MSFEHRTQGLTPDRKMPDSFYQSGFKQYMTRWGYAVCFSTSFTKFLYAEFYCLFRYPFNNSTLHC